MKSLLEFLLNGLLGSDNTGDSSFNVEESEDNGRIIYTIHTKTENIGLIIGKGGKMIKALRNILKVRATLEKKAVALNVSE